ncbi:MAG: hypothetical protein QOG64_431 [Acidimicrobiaceae bacterium]|jgi:hypothetical protein|nr:hypothetical protein [Acidimicrobiaceae bacterium]
MTAVMEISPGYAQSMVPNLRRMAPQLVVAGVLPVIGYALLRPHVGSDSVGLMAVSVFPLGEIAFERIRHGRFEPIGIIALIGITAGIIGAVALHGDATLLKVRESILTGLFGAICLGSLAAPRPVMFYMGRAFATAGDTAKVAEFNTIWGMPGVPRRFRTITAVWGVTLLAEAVVRTVLALSVSTQHFLEISPVLNWTILGALLWYTTVFARSGEAGVRGDLPVSDAELEAPVGTGSEPAAVDSAL